MEEERRANQLYSFVEDTTGRERSKWLHVDIFHPAGGALPDAADWRCVCSEPWRCFRDFIPISNFLTCLLIPPRAPSGTRPLRLLLSRIICPVHTKLVHCDGRADGQVSCGLEAINLIIAAVFVYVENIAQTLLDRGGGDSGRAVVMSARSKLCKLFRDSNIEYNFAIHKFQLASGLLYRARYDKLMLAEPLRNANRAFRKFRSWTIADWSLYLGPGDSEMEGAANSSENHIGLQGGGAGDESADDNDCWDLVDADADAEDVRVVVPGFRCPSGSDVDADSGESASDGEPGWASDVVDEDQADESDDDQSQSQDDTDVCMDPGAGAESNGSVDGDCTPVDDDQSRAQDGTDVCMDPGAGAGSNGSVDGDCPAGECSADVCMADGEVEAALAVAHPAADVGLADMGSWRDALVRGLRDAIGGEDLESFCLRGLREALRNDRCINLPEAYTDYVELLKAIAEILRSSPGVAGVDEPRGGGQALPSHLRDTPGVLSLTWGALECWDWPRISLKELRLGVERQLRRKDRW